MQKWEYYNIWINYDYKQKVWKATYASKEIVGIEAILDNHGQQGWELVNMAVTCDMHGSPVVMLAFFKRPLT